MIAHIKNENEKQTVREHLEAVAQLAAERGKGYGLYYTLFLTGLLHDLGKETMVFDTYIHKAFEDIRSVRRGEVNHSSAGGKYIYEKFGDMGAYKSLTAQLMATAIFSHHGLIDCLQMDGNDVFFQRLCPKKEIFYEEALKNSQPLFSKYDVDELFLKAAEEITKAFAKIRKINREMEGKSAEQLFLCGCLQRLICSILLEADRTDTARFMTGMTAREIENEKLPLLWSKWQDKLDIYLLGFKSRDELSMLRKEISQECFEFAKNKSGIYRLPIPTGGGKTLCSLRFALEHARLKKKKKIIYLAPFLSILEQNAGVIREILEADEYILEHHSNVIREEKPDKEGVDFHQLLVETWESPLILTTMVQFLNVLFSSSTQSLRRMWQLGDAVIIIDEIQSLPTNCIYMFNTMMNFLAYYGKTTIVLCSATQPSLEQAEKKMIYAEPPDIIQEVEQLENAFKRVNITDCTPIGSYSSKRLGDFVIDNLDRNILIILNTKRAVKELYQELAERNPEDTRIIQLTTYMCAEHRRNVIKELKTGLSTQKIICISTQLIEAGVDISFQCVIRSVAGLDSITQAAGRCNRNREEQMGQVYIIDYEEEKLGSLEDIKAAQGSTFRFLNEFRSFREAFDYDLLSLKAMERYYFLYFRTRKREMRYPIPKENTSLYELLSTNEVGAAAYGYRENDGRINQLQMKQAFKQAGDMFEVIGNQTIGIIVPYRQATELIERLRNSRDAGEIRRLLKKLQPFTVNLFREDRQLQTLHELGVLDDSLLEGNLYLLCDGYYNETEGLSEHLPLQIFF